MAMHTGMGPVWRHMRTDRSAAGARLGRDTVRRVLAFATPHKRVISVFLVLTVLDALLVVVNPLVVKQIVDVGIKESDVALIASLAAVMACVAVVEAGLTVWAGVL